MLGCPCFRCRPEALARARLQCAGVKCTCSRQPCSGPLATRRSLRAPLCATMRHRPGHGDVLASHGRQGENTVTSHIWASRPQQGANYLQGKKFEFSIQKLSITFCPLPYKLEGGKFLPQFRRRRRGREGQALCDGACSPPPWC